MPTERTKPAPWRPGPLLAGALLLLLAGLLLASFLAPLLRPTPPRIITDNFYLTERVNGQEFRFSRPRAGLLLPDVPQVPSQIVLHIVSPAPLLPPRPLTVRYDNKEVFTTPVDALPRVYRLGLPPASALRYNGFYLELETPEARAANDNRPLGLMFTTTSVQPLFAPNHTPLIAGVLAVFAGVAGLLLWLRCGGLLAGLLLALLAGVLATLPLAAFWLLSGLALALLLLGALAGPIATRTLADLNAPLAWLVGTPARFLLLLLGGGYTLLLSYYAVGNHMTFGTSNYDLGLYDQALWLISRGFLPYSSGSGRHVIGNHAAYILYPLSLIYWLWDDARMLLIVQVAVTALGIVPIYLIARRYGAPLLGVLAGAVYLAHPSTYNANLMDFHPDTLAATALLFMLWGIDARRWAVVLGGSLVVLACKENFGVTIAFVGVCLLVFYRQWRLGGGLVLLGVGWFLFTTQWLIPTLTEYEGNIFLGRFSAYGDTFAEIFTTFFTQPHLVIYDILIDEANQSYLWRLLLPLGLLLPLLSPRTFALALPPLALNLLSNFAPQKTVRFHYSVLVVAVAAVALLYTLLWLRARLHERSQAWRMTFAASALGLAFCCWQVQHYEVLRPWYVNRTIQAQPDYAAFRHYVLSHIPRGVTISAHHELQPHLTHRPHAYMFTNPFQKLFFYDEEGILQRPLAYIIYDLERPHMPYLSTENTVLMLDRLQARGLYQPVLKAGGVVLLERVAAPVPVSCYGRRWNAPECELRDEVR